MIKRDSTTNDPLALDIQPERPENDRPFLHSAADCGKYIPDPVSFLPSR